MSEKLKDSCTVSGNSDVKVPTLIVDVAPNGMMYHSNWIQHSTKRIN